MAKFAPDTDLKPGDEIVRFDSVVLRYTDHKQEGPEILKDVTFSLPHGSFHFLTGPSGAGKSSLLKLMYLGLRPNQGLVRIFGKDIHKLPRVKMPGLRRRIGVVFQDFRLIPHLTALENVALPLRLAGQSGDILEDNVAELLDWVGLGDKLDAYPPTLSGGEQQRIAIARAVVTKPGLLIADEPTGNVDDRLATRLVYLFEQLNKMGTTVMIATHNDQLVKQFKHPKLHLEEGRLRVVSR